MKTRHVFVPLLDIEELLPFAVKKKNNLEVDLIDQERAKKELVLFIEKLEKNLKEDIFYMGMDIIGEKSYERFIFKNGGFLEVMIEEPLALNAHFIDYKRAQKFLLALKLTLKKVLSQNKHASILIDSLQVQDEEDTSLSVEKWNMMRKIRDI